MNKVIVEENKKADMVQYQTHLDNYASTITDVFDDILEEHGILISDDKDDVDTNLTGLQGNMFEQVKEKVEGYIIDLVDDLHNDGLIYGIIFEEETVE